MKSAKIDKNKHTNFSSHNTPCLPHKNMFFENLCNQSSLNFLVSKNWQIPSSIFDSH